EKKKVEKLHYMHANPVKRGLALEPQQWEWSSSRHYVLAEPGIVLIEDKQKAEMKVRQIA
ncbi:MAG: transposase, partial [Candidatus Sulfotelmatobacter sp.]